MLNVNDKKYTQLIARRTPPTYRPLTPFNLLHDFNLHVAALLHFAASGLSSIPCTSN